MNASAALHTNKLFGFSMWIVLCTVMSPLYARDRIGVIYNASEQSNEIWTVDSETAVETFKQRFKFPENSWLPARSYVEEDTNKLWMRASNGSYKIYDMANDTIETLASPSLTNDYQWTWKTPWMSTLVKEKTDGSLEISDSKGNTVIERKADGTTHIGENSLVTVEESGTQSLYATDADGNAIDINITNGSNLLINGKPITGVSIKEVRKYDSRSVALSAALTSLPTQSIDGSHACGIGSGVRGNYSAMALGCAADLDKIKLFDNAPLFIRNASINLGTSFLTHDDPDYTFKAGLTWSFGKSKANKRDLSKNDRRDIRSTIAEQKNALAINKLQKDNRVLKESNMALTRKLNSLISANKRFVSLASKIELLAQQLESSELVLASN